ncbi:MAG: hypothetical protein ACD_58C00206G0002 [uncultured bacterium]|nr:MAG: hypothetical protein ACD_58C00206G0002 [uncultured bacterium]
MDNKIDIKRILERDWYIQGFNANPIFLNLGGWSGIELKNKLGFGYTSFIIDYKNGYAEYGYLKSDIASVYHATKKRLKNDKNYLIKVKSEYDKIYANHARFFNEINSTNIKNTSDDELLILFKGCSQAQTDSVGLGHLVDAVGIELEKELKIKLIKKFINQKKINKIFSKITTPSKLSFIAQEEKELLKIKKINGKNIHIALENHFNKYFWIQNSYVAPFNLTINDFIQKLDRLHENKTNKKRFNKSKLFKDLRLDSQTKEMVGLIDFVTIWQDQRKANILKSVSYLGKIIKEISIRTKISQNILYQMGLSDIKLINKIDDILGLEECLMNRITGVLFILENDKEYVIEGNDYRAILLEKNKLLDTSNMSEGDLHGSIANPGTAIGKAVICKGIESLKKVKVGDIIVASMTRPEFMPSLRKAVGIVTDEGGITCHAAIVARELGIPAIIGTKIATRVFKDGDIIELKANHGIVRKL